jgi:hypothetical protein
MRKKPPAGMPNINSGQPWSEMDLFDLRNSLEHGSSIEEVAEFLCRDVEEVEIEAKVRGLIPNNKD